MQCVILIITILDNLKILPSYPSYTNGDSGEKISPRMIDNGLPHPPLTGHMVTSTPVKSSVPTIRVSEPDLSHGVKDDIYEELKNQHNQSSTPMIGRFEANGWKTKSTRLKHINYFLLPTRLFELCYLQFLGGKDGDYLSFCFVLDLEDGEGYDHLDFRRPVNDLKPQYLSSESILGNNLFFSQSIEYRGGIQLRRHKF